MQSIHTATPGSQPPRTGIPAALRLGLIVLVSLVGGGFGASACLDRPLCDKDCRPRTTNIFVDTITQNSVDKIDLLFMIDNSISMADKQKVLKEAVPDLVKRLVSPNCVSDTGKLVSRLDDPLAACAPPSIREFTPISNIHIGVITSSLGDHGDHNTCNGVDGQADITLEQQDDHAHLIATRPRFAGEPAKNYNNAPHTAPEAAGFLDWNPTTHANHDIGQFNTTFQMMVTASSEFGCGLEAQLESIYRFIADPVPPQQIVSAPCPGTTAAQKQPCATPTGKDDVLLAQRAAFLRPDSLVAIIMVTDENDCSIRDTQQFFYAARQDIVLPNGSSVCAQNPNDKCCYSCAASPPAGCGPDPACGAKPDPLADSINLRCFNQKQRFGLDFLYPTSRYVNALKSAQLCTSRVDLGYDVNNPNGTCADADHNGQPDLVQNALYNNPNGLPRPSTLVFLAGIVGVPWQDIIQPNDNSTMPPTPFPANELHYKNAKDLAADSVWKTILGDPDPDPANHAPPVLPLDGLMVESRSPRSGNDVTGAPIPGPNGPNNTINGHDWANIANDDLMYACIFKLAETRDCTQVEMANPAPGCDCGQSSQLGDNNPLCQNPAGAYGTTQYFAKGYPGLRELKVLKDFGDNSIVASICAQNLTDKTQQNYGYQPAVDAIVDRLKEALTGRCLPRVLKPDPNHKVNGVAAIPCSIIEVRPIEVRPRAAGGCNPADGRRNPDPKVITPALTRLREKGVCDGGTGSPPCSGFNLCEIVEAGPTCHQDIPNPQQPSAGWCYVDPATQQGDAVNLVAKCQPSERRIIRFVDPKSQTPAQGAQVLIACFGAALDDEDTVTVLPQGGAGAPATGAGGAPPAAGGAPAGGTAAVLDAGAGGGP